ncbi:hypothetical protein EVJ50_14005 [Synechococcus sp. RSCCF101]|uniref:type II secretion system protein GspK n=1 Tax=Synechococcus sp. RSCCF101 TaxID=2511069 RepID=UPI0012471FFF|nr:type II secretion system protein GspK [Synechococcus sp. RSCCF101]QEY33183.1 hypothetical protein EVJ50_14005 [Synechococcus sp. RSCCF101]
MTAPEPQHPDEDVERDLLALRLRLNPAHRLADAAEVRHAAEQGWRLLVQRAGPADWLRLPGCSPDRVDQLMRLRDAGTALNAPEVLQRHLDLSDAELAAWRPVLDFTAPAGAAAADHLASGTARLDLNRASAELLRARLQLAEADLRQLLEERRRGPFRDLQDLQQRLNLSQGEVEGLIGRLLFSPPPRSPSLPPTRADHRNGGAARPHRQQR